MRFKLLGHSGLRVSELCLGTLTFGEESGIGADKVESRKVFDAYVERGGNFLDTANKYSDGTSELWTGEFMAGERDRFVLATKFSLNMRAGDPNAGGNHRKNIMQSVEASLRRLKTDYIDLYWLHQWDYLTPIEEVMRALDDLVRAGKVLYVGISDTPAWVVARGATVAELRGWAPVVALQVEYSLIERTPERDLLPMAKDLELAVTPWGVLGQGVLTGKYHVAEDPMAPPDTPRAKINDRHINDRTLSIARTVQAVAKETGHTSSQVSLAWLRQQPGLILPIVGARTEKQMRDNLGCLDVTLSAEQMKRLDEASRIDLGFPHDFLALPRLIDQRFGGTRHLIDNHRE
jgi:aryl-alcohol dehydrogenase-like predicted oxidoreductase